MTQQSMSAALIQAANQIESKQFPKDADVDSKKRKEVPGTTLIAPAPNGKVAEASTFAPKGKKAATSRSRTLRLEQNRKAARESRRRKKGMIEELQRSLMFFSKSNSFLKQENEVLTRKLLEAHNALAQMGQPLPPALNTAKQQVIAPTPAVAPVVAPAATPIAPAVVPGVDLSVGQEFTTMQPGATMQAMANFQQAAHAAMEAAARIMKAQGVDVPAPAAEDSPAVTGV